MALTNPKIFGLKVTNKLTDVEDSEEVLENLRLELPDLDVIRGSINLGASREDFINFSRLSRPIFKTLDRFYEDIKSYSSVVLDRASISSILFGNLTISGRLDGSSIRYRYRYVDPDDSSALPEYRLADISTSRVSSWSSSDTRASSSDLNVQAKARISYGGQVSIVSSGSESILQFGNHPTDVTGITGKPRLQTSLVPQEREFDAEVPTHTVNINLDGTDVKMYAMKGIPLIFEGTFRNLSARIRVTTSNMGDIKPSWKIVEVDNPNAFLSFPNVLSNVDSRLTFKSSSSKNRFIQFYYRPDKIRWIQIASANIEELPVAKLEILQLLWLENNAIKNMPDLKSFSPILTNLNLRRNPLFNSENPNERRLNDAVLSKMSDKIQTLRFGSTYYGSINNGTNATASLIYKRFRKSADGGTGNGIRYFNLRRYGNLQYFHKDTVDPECHIPNIHDNCVYYDIYRNDFRGIAGGSPIAKTTNSEKVTSTSSNNRIYLAEPFAVNTIVGGTGYSNATNVPTTGGSGTGMTVDITVTGGVVTAVDINLPGNTGVDGSTYASGETITITGGDGNATFNLDNSEENVFEKTIKTSLNLETLRLERNYYLTDESFSIASAQIKDVRITFTNLPIPDLRGKTNLTRFEANHCRNAGQLVYNSGTADNPNEVYKLGNCLNLTQIYISNSTSFSTGTGLSPNGGLHGPLPIRFTNPNLEVLRLEAVRLKGGLVSDDGNKNSNTFNSNNDVIPNTLFEGNGTKLRDFRINSSYFHIGKVGTSVFTHTPNLEILRIRSNKRLTGELPNIGSCGKLRYLDFYNNAFNGPAYSLSSNESLTHVYLHVNQLSGTIPDYKNLPNLQRLRLNQNNFTGLSKFTLPRLIEFRAHINDITGSIPTFADCPRLRFVTLFNNEFTGYTSGAIAQNFQLRLFDVSQCKLGQNALNNIIDDLYENYQASGSSRSVTLNIQNQTGTDQEDISFPNEQQEKINSMRDAGWTIIF